MSRKDAAKPGKRRVKHVNFRVDLEDGSSLSSRSHPDCIDALNLSMVEGIAPDKTGEMEKLCNRAS
jgi:hypothetical protein